MRFEAELVVPDPTLSLKDGRHLSLGQDRQPSVYYEQALEGLAKHFKVSMTTPWAKLPKKAQDAILYGTGDEAVEIVYQDGRRRAPTRPTSRSRA